MSDASTVVAEVGGRSKRSSSVRLAPLQPRTVWSFFLSLIYAEGEQVMNSGELSPEMKYRAKKYAAPKLSID